MLLFNRFLFIFILSSVSLSLYAYNTTSASQYRHESINITTPKHPVVADSVINTHVREAIASHKNLRHLDIKVSSQEGIVTIIGVVDNQAQADSLFRVVKSVRGVKKVRSKIAVKKRY